MNHSDWVSHTTQDAAVRAIASRTGINHGTLRNQLSRGHISAENVILIATAYDTNPVRALVQTGYLAEKWARTVDPRTAIRELSDGELADEVLERMRYPSPDLTGTVDDVAARRADSR